MDKICVIYDEDEVYAKRLMGILTESNMISAAVWLFTDKEKLMENIVKTVQQFLEYSDTKLEELAKKNQALKLQEENQERSKDE